MNQDHPPLVDLSEVTLRSLLDATTTDTALKRSLHHVLKTISNPNEVYSAFGSFVRGLQD